MNDFDVIVIGVGAMGSAACCHLAARGLRVLGIDRFDIPNAMGSSHGLSRMIRTAYYEHPHYVPLLRRAFELWRKLETESGRKLLHQTGGLYMGSPDNELIFGSMYKSAWGTVRNTKVSYDRAVVNNSVADGSWTYDAGMDNWGKAEFDVLTPAPTDAFLAGIWR